MATGSKSAPTTDPEGSRNGEKGLPMLGLSGADAPGVDKIRELLFGNQMQDYDRRFSTLAESFQQKLRDIESESARSQGSLEANLKKQLESIAGQVREEKDLRADADKELDRNQREYAQACEKRIGQLSDQAARLEREMSDRVSHEVEGLRAEIKRRNDDARATLDRMFTELRDVKTDRTLLAGLFVEVARCLNQELPPQLPGKGGGTERS
jgi:chromosome segregation ATPase